MPIYEYECTKCNEEFECIVLGGDTVACPKCDSEKVKRRMSACSFKSGSTGDYSAPSSSSSSGCAGCSGGTCSTCH